MKKEFLKKIKEALSESYIVNIAFDSKDGSDSVIKSLLNEFNAKFLSSEDGLIQQLEQSEYNNKYVISLRKYDENYFLTDYAYMNVSDKDLSNEYWERFHETILYYNQFLKE